MRILIVSFNFAPERTGIGKTVTGRARYLAERGHEVDIVSGFPHYPEWRLHTGYRRNLTAREDLAGVHVLRCWHHIARRSTPVGRSLTEASFGLSSLAALQLPRPDVVFGVMPILSNGLSAWLLARRFRVPFGVFVQDLSARAATQSGMRGARTLAGPAALVERFIMRRAEAIAIITEGFRAPIEAYGVPPHRIHLVPDWTPVERPSIPRDEMRKRLGWPLDRPIALHTGNMGNKQGLENVIDAAREVEARGSNILFVLVGDGSQREMLVERAARHGVRNIHFMPLQDEMMYVSMLGAADVLVLNQRAEVVDMSFPSKLAGYLASGQPVVAAVHSDSEAAQEIRRSEGGLVVPPDAPADLADAIVALLEDAATSAKMGMLGARHAQQRWSHASLTQHLNLFVQRLGGGDELPNEPLP